ncbi:hypothetical protein [Alicyclobacillus acidocaldarius]|nr:hypothetical protein [Alicyclobacillus acidocaldarius]
MVSQHNSRYPVFVATVGSNIVGCADLHPYSQSRSSDTFAA